MKTSTWYKIALGVIGLAVSGQSCSINLGSTTHQDGGVFRSDNHGSSWSQKNFVSQSKKQLVTLDDVTGRILAFDPLNSDHLYLGTLANGIWQTGNGGDQWQPTSLRSGEYDCLAFDALNTRVLYTAAGTVALKSIDGGATWTTIYTEAQPGQAVTCVAVDPLNTRFIWLTTSGGKIMMSQDYGQQWTLLSTVASFQPRFISVDADGSGHITIFTKTSGILRSVDRGLTWIDVTSGLQKYPGATDIRAVDLTSSAWYLGTAYGLLKSIDHGVSWTVIPTLVAPSSTPIQSIAVNPRNPLEIFLATDPRLQHTTDGGASWSITTLPTARTPVLMTFDPTKTDRLFFTTFKPAKKK